MNTIHLPAETPSSTVASSSFGLISLSSARELVKSVSPAKGCSHAAVTNELYSLILCGMFVFVHLPSASFTTLSSLNLWKFAGLPSMCCNTLLSSFEVSSAGVAPWPPNCALLWVTVSSSAAWHSSIRAVTVVSSLLTRMGRALLKAWCSRLYPLALAVCTKEGTQNYKVCMYSCSSQTYELGHVSVIVIIAVENSIAICSQQ